MGRDTRATTGKIGEEVARKHLEQQGWLIREVNWRSSLGELDIIAEDEEGLVVVEVRTTRGSRFGYGVESITYKKQQQVRKLATQYIQQRQNSFLPLRIDVISILLSPKGECIELHHIRGAF